MPFSLRKIVSGGQTGVDRAALDVAIELGLPYGGFVPRGRNAEDGPLDARYGSMTETGSTDPGERTRLNVINSDATLIVSNGPLEGGSKFTEETARSIKKPLLNIDFSAKGYDEAVAELIAWLETVRPQILNVAGPRASEDATIYRQSFDLLSRAFRKR